MKVWTFSQLEYFTENKSLQRNHDKTYNWKPTKTYWHFKEQAQKFLFQIINSLESNAYTF